MPSPVCEDSRLKEHVKRFWIALVSIAGVVGLAITANSVDLLWAFWLVAAGAALFAFGIPAVAVMNDWVNRILNYEGLLEKAAELQEENRDLQNRLRDASQAKRGAFSRGIREGRLRVAAVFHATALESLPVLSSVTVTDDGLALVARFDGPQLDARHRFNIEMSDTGEVKGFVSVISHDLDRGIVLLTCIEETSPEFWGLLTRRAEAGDPTLPDVVTLARYRPAWADEESYAGSDIERDEG